MQAARGRLRSRRGPAPSAHVCDLVTSVEHAGNLVVVKASTGTAQGVAAALDAADLQDVLGSVAGDDTILVVARSEEAAVSFEKMVNRLRGVRP